MAVTYRLATLADVPAIRALMTPAVVQELKDDYPDFVMPTLAQAQRWASNPAHRVVVAEDVTLKGFAVFERTTETPRRWQCTLAVSDKTMIAPERIAVFIGAVRAVMQALPANTPVMGILKKDGRLDTYIKTRIPGRRERSETLVEYSLSREDALAGL